MLVGAALGLAALSALMQVLKYPLDTPEAYGLVRLFDGAEEANFPTFYSSLALLACAALLYLRARWAQDRQARPWMVLAALFLLAALDETVQIHDRGNARIADALDISPHTVPWVVPAALLVLAVALAYRHLAAGLAPDVRRRALLGAALLVGGALGLEAVEVVLHLEDEDHGLAHGMLQTAQELCEMLGVAFILEALALELSLSGDSIRLRFH